MKNIKKEYYALAFVVVLIVAIIFGKDLIKLTGFSVVQKEFENDLNKLNIINEKYNVNLVSFPDTKEKDESLLDELSQLRNVVESEQFNLLLDFRIKLIESDIFFKEGWKYGRGSSLKYGFGCKGLPRLRNATTDRNKSSQIGYEAVAIMNEFIDKYPEEAEFANLTLKQSLFLNASFYKEEKDSRRDIRIIESLCNKDNNR